MDTIYDAKFLVVDDNAELLALLCEQLRGAGYGHIRTAQSCAAARVCFAAEQTVLSVDEALLARLLENLLNNSVRHNPKPVNITVHTRRVGERFCLTVADDGIGYPAAVLAALNAAEPAENAPHILGLYVVQQIAAAHGGTAVFGQNTPCGAKTTVWLPGRA